MPSQIVQNNYRSPRNIYMLFQLSGNLDRLELAVDLYINIVFRTASKFMHLAKTSRSRCSSGRSPGVKSSVISEDKICIDQ